MAVKVLFFARCADWMEMRDTSASIEGEVPLIDLIESTPDLTPVLQHMDKLKIAINHEISTIDTLVKDGDEIAFLPPLSGG